MRSHENLKRNFANKRASYPEDLRIRLRRALSWLDKSEIDKEPDGKFIFLWIAFNCSYITNNNDLESLIKRISAEEKQPSFRNFFNTFRKKFKIKNISDVEKKKLKDFFTDSKLRELFFALCIKHSKREINEIIQEKYKSEIYNIINNKWVMTSFWEGKSWDFEMDKIKNKDDINEALNKGDPSIVLKILFENLYVIRNQIFHGNATYNGSNNRDTVKNGTKILQDLIPLFIEIMMKNPDEDWGSVSFHPDGPEGVKY